jgi:hypothetical protein
MINLSTGLPGHGKTLFTIAFVKELSEKEHRPVFYSGINELALPWEEIDAEKWMDCPPGAIIVIDECQRIFRPRGSGAKVPEYVSALETHRHKGVDIFLITQHPMLMDANVRRLTERHWHICRRFGMQRATIFQFESCKEQPLSNTAKGRRLDWKFPKEVYNYYKSAEVHTVKRRIPVYFYVIAGAILALVSAVWFFIDRHYQDGRISVLESQKNAPQPPAQANGGLPLGSGIRPASMTDREKKPMTADEYITHYTPRIEGLAYTAPAYDEVTKPQEAPVPVACITSKSKGCQCWSQQATRLQMDEKLCRQIIKNGFFRAFAIKGDESTAPRRENAAKAPETASAGELPPVMELIPPDKPMTLTPYRPLTSSSTTIKAGS